MRLPDLGTYWTVPNVLSTIRIGLVIPIAYLVWIDGPFGWLVGLVVLAVLSDWFDGRIARWTRTVSEWGKVLDPIADKLGALLIVTAFTFRGVDPQFPFWFFGLIIGRDVLIVLGGLLVARYTGGIATSTWMGKAAVTWLAITVLAGILRADAPILEFCLWITAGLMVASFLIYLFRALRALWRARTASETEMRSRPSG
jgi:CDP-diacylglycerol--glycerol-3-phosphate 3-phosphatidyltransferase